MSRVLRRAAWLARGAVLCALAALLGCNLYFMAMRLAGVAHPTLLGCSAAVVASGSMEPALAVGDLIVNRAQSEYAVGDIITFSSGSSLTTHRIVAQAPEGYATRGDANNAVDPEPAAPEAVVGRVVARIPRLGSALARLRTPLGLTLLVFVGLLMIELPLVARRARGRSDVKER